MELSSFGLLESIIAITFIYALLSILVSILVEAFNKNTNARGRQLKEAISKLLDDSANLQYSYLFYEHHMIMGITRDRQKKLPQYISPEVFADVLIDIIGNQVKGQAKVGEVIADDVGLKVSGRFIKAVTQHMKPSAFQETLESLIEKNLDEIDLLDYPSLKNAIVEWYNAHMDRVTGWYKDSLTKKTRIAALIVTLALNVDTIHIFKVLNYDDDLRKSLVEKAEETVDAYEELEANENRLVHLKNKILNDASLEDLALQKKLESIEKQMEQFQVEIDLSPVREANEIINLTGQLGIPIGWDADVAPVSWFACGVEEFKAGNEENNIFSYMSYRNSTRDFSNIFQYLLGLIISVYTLGFGAPFWFDALSKLVNLRRAGGKPSVTKIQ